MSFTFFDFLGTIGVIFIVAAYALLQIERIKSSTLAYSLLNALGAFLILISLIIDFNFSAFTIEIIWLGISIFGIYKSFKTKSDA